MNERFEDDEVLALELAEALRETSQHLAEVSDRAKGAFAWRTIDDDLRLAELMSDSATDTETASIRAPGANRVLTFTADPSSVEIEILSDRVVGQLLPPSGGEVEVESERDTVTTVPVDELGFFVIEPIPTGVIRLRCTTSETRLVTEWVRL